MKKDYKDTTAKAILPCPSITTKAVEALELLQRSLVHLINLNDRICGTGATSGEKAYPKSDALDMVVTDIGETASSIEKQICVLEDKLVS